MVTCGECRGESYENYVGIIEEDNAEDIFERNLPFFFD